MARLHLTVRSTEGLTLLTGPPFDDAKLSRIPCNGTTFDKTGSKLAVICPTTVVVYDAETCHEIKTLPIQGAVSVLFSPCGTYLQAYHRAQGQENNAGIWDVETGIAVLHFYQKIVTKSSWPLIQFSDDETVACRVVTSDVQIFDGQDFSKGIVDHLRLPGLQSAQLAFSPPSFIATYVPESKGQPAVVRIHTRQGEAVARRSFFKSSSVKMLWNLGSTGLLVMAFSDDDKSNQSYYGESKLHYLKSDGSHEGTVPLSKEGPIHDAQWSPTGKEFIVVYGFMPAKVTLFDVNCRPVFEFGSAPFNTVRWNSFGTFICLAGFGNLPGDMSFWDRSTLKLMGSTKAPCSVICEWSPDGRLIMTASTAPRMQVDNGIKIFKYTGALIDDKKINKLYQVDWRPGKYTERPASPISTKSNAPQKVPTVTKPAAYRPPHASMAAAARAQLFGEDPEKQSGELSKAALKNKKRREKQKQKEENTMVVIAASGNSNKVTDSEEPAPSGDDVSKKLRALNKKLRQIEELKGKLNGQKPTEAQQNKLNQEETLREEMKKLEL